MSITAAIHPKGARETKADQGAMAWADTYLASSVGQKVLVAITGLSLTVFALFHMIGNLKMFQGPESINKYAVFLKHDLGVLIWIARGGLLGVFLLHLFLTIRLKLKAAAARPTGYVVQRSAQATVSSKTMIWTGVVVGAFIAYHLAHFTFGLTHTIEDGGAIKNYLEVEYPMPDGRKVHNVYAMVVAGFSVPWIAAIYLVAQILLFIHLSHGIQSALTTLGLVGRRFATAAKLLGYGLAGTILAGNVAIVVAVWVGYIR